MSEYYTPTLDEFRAGALRHFYFLIERYGFSGDARTSAEFDGFLVCFRRDGLTISVEGLSYGVVLSTYLERNVRDMVPAERVHLSNLVKIRRPELLEPRYPDVHGQLEDMRFDAAALQEVGVDLLSGDFTAWPDLHTKATAMERQMREDQDAAMQRQDLDRAATRAAEAFRDGNYQRVVDLLAPIEANLGPAQQLKLQMARRRLK